TCGLVLGLAVWTRPDGLTLVPFCVLAAALPEGQGPMPLKGPMRLKRLLFLGLGLAITLLPYFLFNLALSGQLLPNTFFAKQAEYAILLQIPLWQRLAQIFAAPLVGSLVLLVPGLVPVAKQRLLQIVWMATFLFTYALRLPVTYQHARYLMPVLPVL